MRPADLRGRDVLVWGLGREGRAAVRAATTAGARRVTAVDDRPGDGVQTPEQADLHGLGAADVVLVSPGVSRYDPRLAALRSRGVTVTSGSALWMAEHHARTVGITGSKGKSTTTSLVHHLLTALGVPAVLGGNIGVPLLDLEVADRYVVELSSYQCSELQHSPRVVGLTSLFPEHLNWHGSAERYYADKLNIAAHDPEAVVYNATDPLLAAHVERIDAPLVAVGRPDGFRLTATHIAFADLDLLPRADLPLRGAHNALNAAIALAVATQAGVDCVARRDEAAAALRSFAPLPYRLAVVATDHGIDFVDDSLSTAPQAAIAALQAFPDGPVVLIAGGQDRGVDYAPLRDYLAGVGRDIVVVGIPDSGHRIVAEVGGVARTALAGDLDDAVRRARAALPDGGTVLLSPAAPSYGVYRDHIARSAAFQAAVTASA